MLNPSIEKLEAAKFYAELGWPVIPLHHLRGEHCSCGNRGCKSPGKHPRTPNGLKNASVERSVIERWWRDWPEANIGIITGAQSGLMVLDIDPAHGGSESLQELEQRFGALPQSVRVKTGGGGMHIYFQAPEAGMRNSAGKIGKGLDIRGDGGYVVAPPSNHASGDVYEWNCDQPFLDSLQPAPRCLIDANSSGKRSKERTSPEDITNDAKAIPEGQRNNTLARLAGSLRRHGLRGTEITAALRECNRGRCVPPLTDDEIHQIAKSVTRYEAEDDAIAIAAEVEEAKSAVLKQLDVISKDPGEAFHSDTLSALAFLQKYSQSDWVSLRGKLKNKKVPLYELSRALKEFKAKNTTANNSFSRGCDYVILDGALHHVRSSENGPIQRALSNFTARIEREEHFDDGAECSLHLTLSGSSEGGHTFPTITILGAQFASMNWILENWGAQAIVYGGHGNKDHVRTAIQVLSEHGERCTTYGHTGWRRIDDLWVYLHRGGAIGPDGPVGPKNNTRVDLGTSRMNGYELPAATQSHLKDDIRDLLSVIGIAEPTIVYPLLAAVFQAPLTEFIGTDFSIFLTGATGTKKTELSALMQGFFGAGFHARALPGNWTSTANALEKQAFQAKDAVFVVDDFAPNGSRADVEGLHSKAERLLRAQGNRMGRGRMRADGSLKPEYFPRGIIITTGEDLPRGHSLRARAVILNIAPESVDLKLLTKAQALRDEGCLARIMARYIQWLACKLEGHADGVSRDPRASSELPLEDLDLHPRTRDHLATLMLSWNRFLEFGQAAGGISECDVQALRMKGLNAIKEVGHHQSTHHREADPVDQFLGLLKSALATGKAHVANAKGEVPQFPKAWGWRENGHDSGVHYQPQGARIGWVQEDNLYLEPQATYALVNSMMGNNGSLGVAPQTLHKRLNERGYLRSTEVGRQRLLVRKVLEQARRSVLHLLADLLVETEPAQPAQLNMPRVDHAD